MVCAYNHCQTAVTRWHKCYFGQTPEPLLLTEESSLWNLTLNLPKIPPNMRICPQKVAAAFVVVVLSGSDFLKWKSFTFSDQLECLPSTHQRASEDLDRNPESMHLSELMRQKMHYRKRGEIYFVGNRWQKGRILTVSFQTLSIFHRKKKKCCSFPASYALQQTFILY